MSQQSLVFLDRLDGRLSGEIDMATARAAETDFLVLALRTTSPTITIDCTGLTFIDSAGVRMLEHVAKRSGKPVQLTNLPRTCRRILEILDLCEEFGIQPPAPLAAGPVASPWWFPSRGPSLSHPRRTFAAG